MDGEPPDRLTSLFGMAGYYFAGFVLERCQIGPVDLSCGGHNRNGHAIVIFDTKFSGYVSFTDSWYEGPVRIERCSFDDGTDLLNREQHCPVQFDVAPIIDGNVGDLAASRRPRG